MPSCLPARNRVTSTAIRAIRRLSNRCRTRQRPDRYSRNHHDRRFILPILREFGDLVKLDVYLTDLADFPFVNEVMARYFDEPYPARAAIGVASLPKGTRVEMEGVLVTGG